MKRSHGFTIVVILALFASLILATRPLGIFAQGGCPPPAYTNQVFPWAQGTTVNFRFDTFGLDIQDPATPNPTPKFSLSSTNVQDFSTGIQQWNNSNQTDGTNVAFNNSSTGTFPWIVSVAWPRATVTYTASNGQSCSAPR